MSSDESNVERHAGIDMVPAGESFETNWEPADGVLIFAATVGTAELPCREVPGIAMSASETKG
jgi:hypothetical protein